MDNQTDNKLSKEQREAVGILSIGTFLEYFDLMLYVHMAVVLNELFFPKADPHSAAIFAAVAFCSTYVFRPFGALLFGYIGDNIGRKHTVVITTLLMSLSCIVMANLPTYEQIGIGASWAITICRIVQGISSVGEITGAQIYLTEITKPPIQYPAVAYVYFFALVGSVAALTVATFAANYAFDWRIAFWIGAGIALVGAYARRTLRETPDFADAKRKYEKMLKKLKIAEKNLKNICIIKLFDRVHNMQTINFKSIEKQGKIAIETLNHIFPLAIYLEIPKIEQLLKDICSQILSTPIFQLPYSEEELKKKVLRTI
jgi:MHS family proline/betaine transporter-like MFS transporter